MSTCGNCINWRNEGQLAKYHYGTCDARPNEMERASHFTADTNVCRIGRFTSIRASQAAFEIDDEIDMERLEKLSYGGSD